jgi:hypothetical protein
MEINKVKEFSDFKQNVKRVIFKKLKSENLLRKLSSLDLRLLTIKG